LGPKVNADPNLDPKTLLYLINQYCGTGTVGTVTFFLSGTGIHYGPDPVPELDLDSDPT